MNRTRYSSSDSATLPSKNGAISRDGRRRMKTAVLSGETGLSASVITNRTCDFPEKVEPNFLIVRSSQIVTDVTDTEKDS
jgi:hypothetical protein